METKNEKDAPEKVQDKKRELEDYKAQKAGFPHGNADRISGFNGIGRYDAG